LPILSPLRPDSAQHESDVRRTLAEPAPRGWDAILIDTDNGPGAICVGRNARLYSTAGTRRLHAALKPGGVLGVWATDPDDAYGSRLRAAGFRVRTETVRAHRGKGARHVLFLAGKAAAAS